jgi:hypothetical protein
LPQNVNNIGKSENILLYWPGLVNAKAGEKEQMRRG